MKLLIDAGNTRIKWQLRNEAAVVLSGSGVLEAADLFQGITAEQWQAVSSIAVSTVRSEAARKELESVLADYTSTPVRFFWTQPRFQDLVCAYSDPATMGADRWHALIGAWGIVRGACVVVDAGSAITLDWLSEEGRHLGGYILPGRNMMTSSLRQSTARVLFDPDEALAHTEPGHSTAECVFHGVNWLLQALVSQLARGTSVPVMVTGGDGLLIKKALDESAVAHSVEARLCPELVLEGLALVEAG